MKYFAIRDSKAESFEDRLYPYATTMVALRALMQLAPEDERRKHAEDFALYEIGFFDPQTGRFEVSEEPRHVVDLVEVYSEAKK